MQKRQEKVNAMRLMWISAWFILGLFALTGCGANAAPFPSQASAINLTSTAEGVSKARMKTPNESKLEAISGVSYDGKNVTMSVISHGCTSSSDFDIKHEVINNRCGLSIVRTNPDMCRRAPMIAELSLEWSLPANCTGLELFLVNPILVTNTQGSMTKRSK